MAVPKYYEFYNVFLESLQDGEDHPFNECAEYVKQKICLSEEDLTETIPSGGIRWKNTVGWCKTYLAKANLITSPKRGYYQITDEGKQLLKENVVIDNDLLIKRFPSFAKFRLGDKVADKPATVPIINVAAEETPQETFERVYREINAVLADELLSTIHNMTPTFFEKLVVKLMEGMGYGGYEGAGFVTKSSDDGGIDGVIYEDKLGFNLIYIQAKRWALDTVIGRPEIQKFMGALAGPPKIEKGLYITTAKFSKGAREYADAQHIILVDGKKLTELMIEFGIGVTTQKSYHIKRIDSDFFAEE